MRLVLRLALVFVTAAAASAQESSPLKGTQPLNIDGDLSVKMIEGVDRWLDREAERAANGREEKWQLKDRSPAAVEQFLNGKRELLKKMTGVVDPRRMGAIEVVAPAGDAPVDVGEGAYSIELVRWNVFDGVRGEGLLLRPRGPATGAVIALPDAGQTPEQFVGLQPGVDPEGQLARQLAERGALVLVMTLLDRRDTWSGNERIGRFTNQPHREWIYRQSFELGRTPLGYEVQKVLAAVESLRGPSANLLGAGAQIGVLGHGEGGRVALVSAALDARIQAAYVSGYFGAGESISREAIDRNLMGFQREIGDSGMAALVWPRTLALEFADPPRFFGPSMGGNRSRTAAPGEVGPVDVKQFAKSARVAQSIVNEWPVAQRKEASAWLKMGGRKLAEDGPEDFQSVSELLQHFTGPAGLNLGDAKYGASPHSVDVKLSDERQARTVRELQDHSQRILRDCERARKARPLWTKLKPGAEWDTVQKEARAEFWEKVIGKLSTDYLPANPRTRQIYDREKWRGYEVMLDVHPDVFAWGILLLPKDLKPGERRPVVVCQHGLEGAPADTITDDRRTNAWKAYKSFAAQLADRGFIVYAPHNPYRGQEKFRWLQRKANPLGLSLFSFIIAQHDVTTRWLASLPFVDPDRIGFYGLSYGGKTAMRVPAVLDRYSLSICSADFNEWVLKCVSDTHPSGYIYTSEWEIWEWDLGHTFNYAEMALLIAPRPFMVERGHEDGVGLDEHVGYEWAKVLRGYTKLGAADRAAIEWFDGPHTINGVGTFRFLHGRLGWPQPK